MRRQKQPRSNIIAGSLPLSTLDYSPRETLKRGLSPRGRQSSQGSRDHGRVNVLGEVLGLQVPKVTHHVWSETTAQLAFLGPNYLKLPALGLKQGKSRWSPQPMWPENMAALHKPLSNSKNPLQAGLRKRKEHLALEQDGVWGQAWCEPAELLLSVLKATQVFVVHLTHGAFTCYTFFPVSTFGVVTIFHKRQGDTPEIPRSGSACILLRPMLAMNTVTGPDGHKPGLPTGGKLLPIMKLSPRFGSCIFHVHRETSHLFTRSLSQLISVQFSTSVL